MNVKKKGLIIVTVVFIGGLFLRLYSLGSDPPGLYVDELDGLLGAYIQFHGAESIPFLNISIQNIHSILYDSINGYFLSLLFGLGNFSARFPFALFGSLMAFPIYGLTVEFFSDRRLGLISATFWEVAPAMFVMSRDADGVEIFPLFIFLIILYFAGRLIHKKQPVISLFAILFLTGLSLYIRSISAWSLIPIALSFLAFIFFILLKRSETKWKYRFALWLLILPIISGIILIIFASGLLFAGPLSYLANAQVNYNFFIFSLPPQVSIPDFFLRFGAFLSPYKLFLIGNPFSPIINIHPVLVQFALPFLAVPFYGELIYFVYSIVRRKMQYNELLVWFLFLIGFLQPVFNISNPISSLEPAEALFASPFLIVISSLGVVRFLDYLMHPVKTRTPVSLYALTKNLKIIGRYKKKLYAIIMVIFVMFASISTVFFFDSYFTTYKNTLESSTSSPFYTTYGLHQASDFLVDHNLTSYQIFFVPSNGGGINFSNSSQFNYWVYYLHFPSAWFYIYTHQKVSNVNVLSPGTLPDPSGNETILISQNASYGNLLSESEFSYRLLYSLNRSSGVPAIFIYQILPNYTLPDKPDLILNKTGFNGHLNSGITLPVNHSFTSVLYVTVNGTPVSANMIFSEGYGLYKGTGSADRFPWLELPNDTIVPFSNLYSRITSENYSIPHSWWQFADHYVLKNGSTFMISVTYNDGIYSMFFNDTLIGSVLIPYPVSLSNLTVNIPDNYTADVFIYDSALRQGYLYDIWNTV